MIRSRSSFRLPFLLEKSPSRGLLASGAGEVVQVVFIPCLAEFLASILATL